jgi:hypothetical protein
MLFSPVRPSVSQATRIDLAATLTADRGASPDQIRFTDVSLGTSLAPVPASDRLPDARAPEPAAASRSGTVARLDVSPLPNTDEELFLVYALESVYATWPRNGDSRQQMGWFTQSRGVVSALRSTIRERALSADLAKVYDDFIRFEPQIESYLKVIAGMDQRAAEQVATVAAQNIKDGLAGGVLNMLLGGGSDEQEAIAADAAVSAGQRASAIARQNESARGAERDRLQTQLQPVLATLRSTTQQMGRARGWRPGETGFASATSLVLPSDQTQRPRDPFLLLKLTHVEQRGELPEDVMAKADLAVKAARLVPADAHYDSLRTACLDRAVELGFEALTKEKRAYRAVAPASAAHAAQLCRAYLAQPVAAVSSERRSQVATQCEALQ